MKTRMELWKGYRDEIEKNIILETAVQSSDEKLNILYKRLIEAYPEYEQKFKSAKKISKLKLQEIDQIKKYDSSKIQDILNEINDLEKDYSSLSSIDKLNFSSKELDSIIREIKKGKIKKINYFDQGKNSEIELITKTVDLGVANVKINIAIDGPSGSGKSSAAKLVADKFGLKYINTGLIYRAVALMAKRKNITIFNNETITPLLKLGIIELLDDEVVYLSGHDITKEVRADDISQIASKVAVIPEVRKYAQEILQETAKQKGVVMDGRDITFKIMPNAELKFFIDTDPEVRAERRVRQNKELGFNADFDEILKEIKERDYRDRNREMDPLQIVSDAIVIDSSEMNLDEVVEKISNEVKKIKGR